MAATQIEYTPQKLIKQTERLLTIRPRSIVSTNSPNAGEPTSSGNRGTRARIRLLSSNPGLSKFRIAGDRAFSGSQDGEDLAKKLLSQDPNYGFNDFFLTDVSVNIDEKVQIVQTFGDTEVVYYFGKAPVVFNLSGLLFDDMDNQWFTRFINAYSTVLRGTQLAANYEVLEFTLPNMIVVGSVMGMSYQQNSARDTDISFNLRIHAKELRAIPVQVPGYAMSPNANMINFSKASEFLGLAQITSMKNKLLAAGKSVQGIGNATDAMANFSGSLDEHMSTADRDDAELGLAASTAGKTGKDLFAAGAGAGAAFTTSAVLSKGADLAKSAAAGLSSFGSFGSSVGGVASTLAGLRASLFSPIYGVLTSITRIVKSVTGDITSIISSFTNPVNSILRDIKGIANQAVGLINLVQNSVNSIINGPLQTLTNIRNTITALRRTVGIIARAPETIASSIRRLAHIGLLNGGAAFLSANGTRKKSKVALLNSGRPYTPLSGARVT
jgi:hypothetical protein